MSQFIFDNYSFDSQTGVATFKYLFDDGRSFKEEVVFNYPSSDYDEVVLDRALRLAFLVSGTSYLKTFPAREVKLPFAIDSFTAEFLNHVYQEGLSQFAFENGLTRNDLPDFTAAVSEHEDLSPSTYNGQGILALQSGGKDSLLLAQLLHASGRSFTPWYLTSGVDHPKVLDTFEEPLNLATRKIDHEALKLAGNEGGKNGHVPVTYIVQSLALVQAIVLGKNEVLVSIAHEGEEPHAVIGDLSVTHQWSKTWQAEQLFAEYVNRYISPDLRIGSPLRRYSELRVSELFVEKAWAKYGHSFSSCNVANYKQGENNTELRWCGNCPKCANAFLLFAPFLPADDLKEIFGGQDLFQKPSLQQTFKGLLGIDGVMKPFECIGEVDELRVAYQWALGNGGYGQLSFEVPHAEFDYKAEYPYQEWAHIL